MTSDATTDGPRNIVEARTFVERKIFTDRDSQRASIVEEAMFGKWTDKQLDRALKAFDSIVIRFER